ncbi:RAD50-interacting protein 1 [Eumeta japonica]|uniref:RAD50-interacting protein 1 n=1 Tax=Eumeta variegata TaxID=151549 RepID=A0A4C1V601_EUMVA|nr:RAD50-interacting protein 1 [Eumeta japonica]
MNEELKRAIIQDINSKVGSDITNLVNAHDIENELVIRRNHLQSCLTVASNEVPTKLAAAVKKAEKNSEQIKSIKDKSEVLKNKVNNFLNKTEKLRNELSKKFTAIEKLEEVLLYLKSFEKIEDLRHLPFTPGTCPGVTRQAPQARSRQLKQCGDDEQAVLLYGELKSMCSTYTKGHRASFVKETTHFWHNILKERLTKQYENALKTLQWPFTTPKETSAPSKESLAKFSNLTKYLFLIEEPKELKTTVEIDDLCQDQDLCLPVKVLLKPLKKRFIFHFTGSRKTARIDRPEWFLTQTLTWIKDHNSFIKKNIQPIVDKLQIKGIKTENEFNTGLIALAAERLHTVLGMYNNQEAKEEILDTDAAFAHAVDETLGFHRELITLTGKEANIILGVLTKAEIFVKWLAVEKKLGQRTDSKTGLGSESKVRLRLRLTSINAEEELSFYVHADSDGALTIRASHPQERTGQDALIKMEESLSNEQWMEAVAGGAGAAVGAVVWVPRGADWFISLLKTIEDRYALLPQPGHRLQFVELQLELIEEWRVRLTQLLGASLGTLESNTFTVADDIPHPLTAVINAAHYTRTVLLQWAQSLVNNRIVYQLRYMVFPQHYLQLYYYRKQFQHFTQQHHDDSESVETVPIEEKFLPKTRKDFLLIEELDETMSLIEVEVRANKMALHDITHRDSVLLPELNALIPVSPLMAPPEFLETNGDTDEPGVWDGAPGLLLRLRDAGLTALAEHIMLEFKATLRDYSGQKWHAMPIVEEMALSVSPSLCRPLSGLCARLHAVNGKLAPPLCAKLRAHIASEIDVYVFEWPSLQHENGPDQPMKYHTLTEYTREVIASAVAFRPEVVLESWWSTGGTAQFCHDVKRNLVPAFAPPSKATVHHLPRLMEACQLLNMDYDDARRLRAVLLKSPNMASDILINLSLRHILPQEAKQQMEQEKQQRRCEDELKVTAGPNCRRVACDRVQWKHPKEAFAKMHAESRDILL